MTLLAFAFLPSRAVAFEGDSGEGLSHAKASAGFREVFYRPRGADHGQWSPGAQARLRLSDVYALESSADFTRSSFSGSSVYATPLQATLIGYFYPDGAFSPYVLAGLGWYIVHTGAPPAATQNYAGPHAGAGLELLLGGNWSVDGSYRYLWSQAVHLANYLHPFGRDLRDRGFMITAALNRRF